jgi:hypothetical protein
VLDVDPFDLGLFETLILRQCLMRERVRVRGDRLCEVTMCPALPDSEYYGGSAPSPHRSVDGGPSPITHAGSVGSGKDRNGSRVHLQLARRRRSPTLSLRHRHDYPAALHRGLPGEHPHAHPRVPHPTNTGNGCAPHPAHIHQIGAGEPLRDVVTLVPRVLLFVTLAEPTPSGSTGISRLSQGCSHAPRHLPGRAALSCTALLRQDGDEGLPPPFELSATHGACGSRLTRAAGARLLGGSPVTRCRDASLVDRRSPLR